MNTIPLIITLSLGTLSVETARAENKVMRTITTKPPYTVTGPIVSVIIITYNEEKYLPSLLSALSNQTYQNLEVIVTDNMSEDSTVKIAQDWGAKVITNSEYNLSKSRNMGAREAQGNILVFIDADTIPEHVAIDKVVKEIDNGAQIVLINRCCTDSYLQSIARVGLGWIQGGAANGQFIAVTRQVYDSVGGFDESIMPPQSGEDVEFIESVMHKFPVARLRTIYAGTSARRQEKEGYIVPHHWQGRAIRGRSTHDRAATH